MISAYRIAAQIFVCYDSTITTENGNAPKHAALKISGDSATSKSKNLGRVSTMFVGPNNLGKTTALEAIWSLLSLGDTELSVRISHWLRNAQMPDMDAARHILSSFFHKMKADKISLSGDIESRGQKSTSRLKLRPSSPPPVSQSPYTHPSNSPALPASKLPFDRIQSDWKQSNHTHISGSFAAQVTHGGIEHTNMNPNDNVASPMNPAVLFCSQRDVVSAVASLQKSGKMESAIAILQQVEPDLSEIFLGPNSAAMVRKWRSGNAYAHHGGNGVHDDFVCIGPNPRQRRRNHSCRRNRHWRLLWNVADFSARHADFGEDPQQADIRHDSQQRFCMLALQQVLTENESLREDAVCFKFMRDKHGEVWANPYNYEAIDHCDRERHRNTLI